jgi:hypothetical protein
MRARAWRWRCQIAESVTDRNAHDSGGGWAQALRGATSDDGDISEATVLVRHHQVRDILGPEHFEVRLNHLVLRRQVEPYLEELEGVLIVDIDEGEHLCVLESMERRRNHPWLS